MRIPFVLSFCLISIISFARHKKEASPFIKNLPVPHRAVNDFGKFLTVSEKQYLEKELVSYHKKTSNAIVIITLDSLTDPKTKKEYTVEETALLYFNKWGIGDSIKNNGVLLLLSRKPHRVRIEVGKGLENVLTNAVCQQIVDDKLVPSFKEGLFFTGLKEAVQALENNLDNPPPPPQTSQAYTPPAEPYSSEDFKGYRSESSGDWGLAGLFFGGTLIAMIAVYRLAMRGRLDSISRFGYRSHYYNNQSYYDNSYQNNSFSSSDNDSFSSFSSGSSSDSSSSGSSSDSFSGGSSDGGGASGSW